MLLLGLDLETTGLDPETDRITEVGLVLWDTNKNKPILIQNDLVDEPDRKPLTPFITELTGITDQMLDIWGVGPATIITQFSHLVSVCDYVVAHNGNKFDRPFMNAFVERNASKAYKTFMGDKEWIDTKTDLPLKAYGASRKLNYIAADHGFINPWRHRAVTDVLTMMKVLSQYDIDEVIKIKNSPEIKYIAKVSYHEREQAKAAGFEWDGEKKIWHLTVKECFFDESVIETWGFRYELV